MSTVAGGEEGAGGVVFSRDPDGSFTASDLETGLSRGGETRAEALAQLAEVLAFEEGGGEPIDDDFLQDELGICIDDRPSHDELPKFLQ